MPQGVIEAHYPLRFREHDAKVLGDHLRHRHSVELIGMKRVGISNFLRFFLNHPEVRGHYIAENEKHLFIAVDLNDLVEREQFPFWTLTLKRIVDATEKINLPENDKSAIDSLFLRTIQTQDHFMAIDSVRAALVRLLEHGYLPTLFFIRFDRIKEALTPAFFDNLHGLKEATHHKISFVFTSYRSLDQLAPEVFPKAVLSAFAQPMFIKLASEEDSEIIFQTYQSRYQLKLPKVVKDALLRLTHGNVQYLQLSLIILHERAKSLPATADELFQVLALDERVTLQSEELWESLSPEEQMVLLKISQQEPVMQEDKEKAPYLWETGFVITEKNTSSVFSPLLQLYLTQVVEKNPGSASVHFSKKEHALFSVLEKYTETICERETIIEAVWPESKEFGISDWAIDRLVARVRSKLKQQQSPYEIKTIRTRGYQLIEKS